MPSLAKRRNREEDPFTELMPDCLNTTKHLYNVMTKNVTVGTLIDHILMRDMECSQATQRHGILETLLSPAPIPRCRVDLPSK